MTKKTTKKTDYKIDLKELLDAGCHFGHQARRWNPKMKQYIYVKRDGVHIFDLEKTAAHLSAAMEKVRDLVAEGKEVVFVGTKRQASSIVEEEAKKVGAPYVAIRWLGGTVTNWEQIKKGIDKLNEYEEKKAKGEFKKYTKKENLLIAREMEKLDRFLGGLKTLTQIPEAIFVVDIKKEVAAVKEAKIRGLELIAMVDSNADPDVVTDVIPANDDAVRSIKLVVAKMAQAYSDGKGLKGKKPKAKS
ncbi:MAG: 30S ribosomal protein S2 [Candidatus Beckwithbacteria bacterium GW2011_GWB1_47_15]|uniref:Small ribosomal subunit protein uS2 n=1 Tax=Candidatus Beckwithbacteria bacterium GW2011_GWB1_47_15 TaxID=1618371 RepID=A0A0G1RWE8_9BACT|nr:MAG: 30S ribosomal protein S2, small subunit ribosomal protein S2 [Candidatus Beckwithbacteria bacterium GW2011_GWC1_49_16]KKU35356.1 MAG: 30S ribosomal protein S2 [Candidatus Beckwithbacteria bacterium GW2011_GWA1_46_30]KKU61451.1 MAG: 30S ribosomal protein S2 [Candidatus Beckwithbacteria bacterium GW2011_GWB1_47_15]KKU71858.1 MAG: 30S ribosomal protein S2 [Candidatus Beckwithbacteria bacterium GW2011_GWA2_47_25]KKW03753.1 MAG: 30S ribosomal protein S2 [Candidatus Beckwithbacteria bacterium